MEIFVNRTFSAADEKKEKRTPLRARLQRRERRQKNRDRRRSVNEGLIVTLSVENERRSRGDRRKVNSEKPMDVTEFFPLMEKQEIRTVV